MQPNPSTNQVEIILWVKFVQVTEMIRLLSLTPGRWISQTRRALVQPILISDLTFALAGLSLGFLSGFLVAWIVTSV